MRQAEFDVAAEDGLSAHFEFGGDTARQAADRRERRDAEEEADREEAEAANPGRKVAPRDPPERGEGEHQPILPVA